MYAIDNLFNENCIRYNRYEEQQELPKWITHCM